MLRFITDPFFHTPLLVLMILFALVSIRKDQTNIRWRWYLPLGLIAFSLLYLVYVNRGTVESWVLDRYFAHDYLRWNWDTAFRHIPFNNGWMFRLYQPHWLTLYMSGVYRSAFYMNLWVGVLRGFFAKDIKKMVRYMFAGLIIQMVIIEPFYHFVLLQEVWYVQGQPDMLHRRFPSKDALLGVVADCFPSMHTSTAVAVLLLALREKGKWFKWLMVVYGTSVVLSTQYLKIHWLLDVFAGILLAYVSVKCVDWILDKAWPALMRKLQFPWFDAVNISKPQ